MKHHTQNIKNKLRIILLVFLCTTFIICIRLFNLQIRSFDKFQLKSKKNFLRLEKVYPKRGNILDSTGKLLATNRPIHNLYWQGSGTYNLSEEKINILKYIGQIINKNIIKNKKLLAQIKHAERFHKKTLIASDINFDQLSKIEEQFPYTNAISISTSFKRFYPYRSLASHILGYLGRINVETTGKMGLEKMFEDMLKGKSGSIIKTINSFGKKLSETTIENALSGRDIKITLNINMQRIVEKIFPKNEIGTMIVMNPQNGAIVALVSQPNFDPNIFLQPILKNDWEKLQENNPFLNRAFDACYPPGSIFKLVTTSAALEHNIIDPDQNWDCKGYVYFGGRKYLCHKLDGHGELTTSQALEQSCNTFFYDIAKKIDIDLLADYAHRFGLGKKTSIIFPEKNGIVPSRKWKFENKGEQWWPGETLSTSIGQSFLLTTPIQVACMVSSIFTGYLVTPRILEDEPISMIELPISETTLEFLRKSMKMVAQTGTGRNISRIKNLEIYMKTSTAQTSALYKRKFGHIYREHRWLVAYFQYKDHDPLTLVILIEHSESARAAKNTARKFLIAYKLAADRNMIG